MSAPGIFTGRIFVPATPRADTLGLRVALEPAPRLQLNFSRIVAGIDHFSTEFFAGTGETYGSGSYLNFQFGGQGTANGQIRRAGGIGIAPDGKIWVDDAENDREEVFTPSGSFLFAIGGAPSYSCETSPAGSEPACPAGSANGEFGAVTSGYYNLLTLGPYPAR